MGQAQWALFAATVVVVSLMFGLQQRSTRTLTQRSESHHVRSSVVLRNPADQCATGWAATHTGEWLGTEWVPLACRLPLLKPLILQLLQFVKASKHPKITIAGDSQAKRLREALAEAYGGSCNMERVGAKCDDAQAFAGIAPGPRSPLYVPAADVDLENRPHPWCMACGGCESRLQSCLRGAVRVENLGVEYAHSNEVTSSRHNATEDVFYIEYLLEKAPPAVLIFNTGLHDVHATSPAQYREQVDHLASLAVVLRERHGTRLLWLQTTQPDARKQPEKWRNITSAKRIAALNVEVLVVARKYNIPVLDTFAMTDPSFGIHDAHGIHQQRFYYPNVIRAACIELLKPQQ
eukprot:m.235695 g.235695  ORF g.235695 m.235695 type:complete len:349 (+) comp18929_c0_seq4:64-1110(+)